MCRQLQEQRQGKVPYVFHLWLQDRLLEQFPRQEKIKKSEAMDYFHKYKIPKALWPVLLKELELLGFVENVDRLHIKVVNYRKGYVHNVSRMLLDMGVEPA